jgi:hypothetical protein
VVTSALILAARTGDRWDASRGFPRHLAPVPDEPAIHRLQRELVARGVEDVMVACQSDVVDDYVTVGRAVDLVTNGERWVHEWQETRAYWPQHRLLILYGDCYHSPELLDALVADDAPGWRYYARWGASSITGKPWGEPWGWVIQPEAHDELDAAAQYAAAEYRAGRYHRCIPWEVYRRAAGFALSDHRRDSTHGVEWSDLSEDFDWVEDYDRWLAAFRAAHE